MIVFIAMGLIAINFNSPFGFARQSESIVPVDDFMLLDQNGVSHQLTYYSDKKAIVLIAHGIGCPILRQNIVQLTKLQEEFGPKGVAFFMINAVTHDQTEDIARDAKEFQITIPVLKDDTQLISKSLGLSRMSEVIVVDPREWKIVYRGAVDDRLNYESQKIKPAKEYLRDVLEAVIGGKEIPSESAPVKGCLIGYSKDVKAQKVSYEKHIVPILTKSCVPCHSAGGIAPWSMDRYERVKGWGSMIREVVRIQRMPPWQADPQYGKFLNDISLTAQEKIKLVSWIENGAPRSGQIDPLVKSSSVIQHNEWILGPPDAVFAFDQERTIPATGVMPYQVVPADKPLEQDVWVRAVDLRPGNRKVVHHCDVAVAYPEPPEASDAAMKEKSWLKQSGMAVEGVGQIVAGYAPGYDSLLVMPADTGLFLPKGSKLNFWMHYVPIGKEEKDRTQLGLYFYSGVPSMIYSVVQLSNKSLAIPPGEANYRISASYVFEKNAQIVSLTPHMHYRGHSMRITAYYPDGTSEILLSVPHYKFNWQRRYILKEPKKVPAGTKLVADGVFDNSVQNTDNPDPSQLVKYGSQSDDEMFSAFIAYTTVNDR